MKPEPKQHIAKSGVDLQQRDDNNTATSCSVDLTNTYRFNISDIFNLWSHRLNSMFLSNEGNNNSPKTEILLLLSNAPKAERQGLSRPAGGDTKERQKDRQKREQRVEKYI